MRLPRRVLKLQNCKMENWWSRWLLWVFETVFIFLRSAWLPTPPSVMVTGSWILWKHGQAPSALQFSLQKWSLTFPCGSSTSCDTAIQRCILPLSSSGDPSYKRELWVGKAHGWKCDILWQRYGGIFETLVDNSGKDLLIIFALPSVWRILRLEFFKKIVLKGSPARWQNRTSVIHQRQHGQAVSLGKTKTNCLSSIPN